VSPFALLSLLASAQAGTFSFAVVGDTQGSGTLNYEVMPQIVQDMNALDPALVFFVGDLIGGYYTIEPHQQAWEEWVAEAWKLNAEIYAVPGNHDFFPGEAVYDAWSETFDWLPTDNSPRGQEGMSYHVDYGDSRFIAVLTDSEWGQVPPDQDWLDSVLGAPDTQAADHVFVFSHHPVSFSTVEPLGNSSDAFWQSLVGAGVGAYFCGHWHRYQPSQLGAGGDTWETIIGTGGGSYYAPWRSYQQLHGFQLVEVDGDSAVATFYGDADGDGHYDDAMDQYVIAWGGEPERGLRAHYGFEGGSLEDDAPQPLGAAVHGRLTGSAAVVEDEEHGWVLELPGGLATGVEAGSIGDYVLSINGDLSLSLFARADQPGWGEWGQVLLAYGTADYYSEDEETNYSWWLSVVEGDHLLAYWEYEDGSNLTLRSTAPVPDPQSWHHYAVVRDAEAMELSFLVDGEPLGQPLSFERLPTGGGRGMLYMGRDVEGSDGYELRGRLDEICVFDRGLEQAEIRALAAGYDCLLDGDGDGLDDFEGDCDDGDASLNLLDADSDGHSSCDGDCDDDDASVHPDAEERCDDGLDNDCDGAVDEPDCVEDDTGEPAPEDSAEPDDTDNTGDDTTAGEEGCGCSGAPDLGFAWMSALAGMALLRRRRRELR
jgi:uncharacterized protein (TIGR03382 family)